MAARCVGVFSKIAMLETMNQFLECVLPCLAAIDDCTKQEGSIEALACILSYLKLCVGWKWHSWSQVCHKLPLYKWF